MNSLVIIPARYASTRFPGKPLALLGERPVIAWVVERARAAAAGPVWVATDDARIAAAAGEAGAEVVMTRADHPSGTDRVAEAVRRVAGPGADQIVINLQGDEPLIDPTALQAVLAPFADPAVEMATLATPLAEADASSPHLVKVVCDARGRALYFSRAPIPYGDSPGGLVRQRHLGIYAYRRHTLQRLASLPQAPAECSERLEQLRALHHGIAIHVREVNSAWRGVDTPEDLAALAASLQPTAEQS